jgi:multidrug efflux pump subunit AcrA (membrane-fusion protein)
VIVARYASVGELISKPDQGLFDLVGTTCLIEVPVPSRLLSSLKDSTPIEVAVDVQGGEKTFKTKVVLIAPVIDPRNKTIKVQFSIPEAEMKTLKPGTIVAVKIGTRKDGE